MLMTAVVVVLLIGFCAFVWFWWFGPKDSVQPHFNNDDLRKIEVQDRLRQTNYQLLTALGLVATFAVSIAQFLDSRNHWESDFKSKAEQDRLSTFMNAVKLINDATGDPVDNSTTSAGIRTLGALGAGDTASEGVQATEILSNFVMLQTRDDKLSLRYSKECATDAEAWTGESPAPEVGGRPEAKLVVQAAMRMLGDQHLATFRQHAKGAKCVAPSVLTRQLRLEHAILDNTDLSRLDLSCSMLSNARFRRASLYGTNLAQSDLRAVRFADYDIPSSPAQRADNGPDISGERFWSDDKNENPPLDWQKYRCWISDLREANLSGTNLEGAAFDGADLRKADFTGASFKNTDLSRANLKDAIGLTEKMLQHACAGVAPPGWVDKSAQPVGLPESLTHKGHLAPCLDKGERTKVGPKEKAGPGDFPTMAEMDKADEDASKQPPPSWGEQFLSPIGGRDKFAASIGWPLLAVVAALILFDAVGDMAQSLLVPRGNAGRGFLPSRFPEKTLSYSARDLQAFISRQPDSAKLYRLPILVPLDLLVMLALAASSAYASSVWFSAAGYEFLSRYSVVFPVLYLVVDLLEDVFLFHYLRGYAFDERDIARLKRLTLAKLIFVSICFVQIAGSFAVLVSKLLHAYF